MFTFFVSSPLVFAEECEPVFVYDGVVKIKTGYIGAESYFDLTVMGVPVNGWIPLDGVYDGWCADTHKFVDGNTWYNNSLLYSSLDPDLPWCMDNDEDWDKVNYLLNQIYPSPVDPIYTAADKKDIQQVVWNLTDAGYVPNSYKGKNDYWEGDLGRINAILADVEDNYESFGVPQEGQYFAILVSPNGALGDPCSTCRHQLIFFPHPIPPCFEIPELPFGTLTALVTPIMAFALTYYRKKVN
jgi:hypothetical protein